MPLCLIRDHLKQQFANRAGVKHFLLIVASVVAGACLLSSAVSASPHVFFDAPESENLEAPVYEFQPETTVPDSSAPRWNLYYVSDTDSIWTLFKNEGLSEFDLMDLFAVSGAGQYLSRLDHSPTVRYQIDEGKKLLQLHLAMLTGENILFERFDRKFLMTVYETGLEQEGDHHSALAKVSGEISGSFYLSGKKAGLSASTITQFASIFQWYVDFNRDIQAGDRFDILLASDENSNLPQGTIVAASFTQNKRSFSAVLNNDGQYYTPEGKLIGSAFSRDPLKNGARVSSGFDLNRIHPITGIERPHLGTDWATPVGTPVYAVADGNVNLAITGHPMAGNYIELRNGRRYVTRYLHLDRLSVKAGQQVKKGDLIGYSGNTGLSTGPHLHFELYVDGQAQDIMTAELPDQEQLKGLSLQRFQKSNTGLLAQLNSPPDKTVLAMLPED